MASTFLPHCPAASVSDCYPDRLDCTWQVNHAEVHKQGDVDQLGHVRGKGRAAGSLAKRELCVSMIYCDVTLPNRLFIFRD